VRLRSSLISAVSTFSLFGIALAIPSTAHAAANQPYDFSDCQVGLICMWTGTNGQGLEYSVRAHAPGGCTAYFWAGGGRSAYNRTGITQRLFSSWNCTGPSVIIQNGRAIESMSERHSIGGFP
jgi:hypothetical protein